MVKNEELFMSVCCSFLQVFSIGIIRMKIINLMAIFIIGYFVISNISDFIWPPLIVVPDYYPDPEIV